MGARKIKDMKYIFLLLISVTFHARGQVVTSSFDRTTLSQNPAAAATRTYGQFALFDTFRTTDSDIDQDGAGTTLWNNKIKINKLGAYITGHGRVAPELYLSQDSATIDLEQKASAQTFRAKANLTNNFINLGLRMTSRFFVGLKAYSPAADFKQTVDLPGLNFEGTTKINVLGLGGGFTYHLLPKIYVGGYYVKISEKFKSSFTANEGGVVTSDSTDEDVSYGRYGAGISYLSGNWGNGTRLELSYSKQAFPKELAEKPGEEVQGSIEFSFRLISFGLNAKYRKNQFYDSVELLNYAVGDKISTSKWSGSYGGFFTLGSGKGHSVGLSGYTYSINDKRDLFGAEEDADSRIMEVTVNYAYVF